MRIGNSLNGSSTLWGIEWCSGAGKTKHADSVRENRYALEHMALQNQETFAHREPGNESGSSYLQ